MRNKIIKKIIIVFFVTILAFGFDKTGDISFAKEDEAVKLDSVYFDGTEDERIEIERLLMSKLVYSYLDGYEGKTISEYVKDNPDLYDTELWSGSGITYETIYSCLIGDWEILRVYNHNTTSGFYAVVFKKDMDIVYTFRGSEMFTEEFAFDESNDWIGTDFKFAILNELSPQFDDADICMHDLQNKLGADRDKYNITLAGHSLGGALVCYESLVTGLEGYSFDGAAGHVIDLCLYYRYLDIDSLDGAEDIHFCNYTDETGYRLADLIQHTYEGMFYQIDRQTQLENLVEYTAIPRLSDAGSHIAWSTIYYEGDRIYLTPKVESSDEVYTYKPDSSICLDIEKNVIEAAVENLPEALWPDSFSVTGVLDSIEFMVGSIVKPMKDGRAMVASSDGSSLVGYRGIGVYTAFQVSSVIYGGMSDDILIGTASDDVLIAGRGNDNLYGGLGNDTYIIDYNKNCRTKIEDYGGYYTTIVFRNMHIYDLDKLTVQDDCIVLNENQKIILSLSQPMDRIKLCTYENGSISELGTLGDIKNCANLDYKLDSFSNDVKYLVFLEGKGSFNVYDGERLIATIDNIGESASYTDDGFSVEYYDFGVAYVDRTEDKESILLSLDKKYKVTVSNEKNRVNLALAKYSDKKGLLGIEKKYKRRFDDYSISLEDNAFDEVNENSATYEDIFAVGISIVENAVK